MDKRFFINFSVLTVGEVLMRLVNMLTVIYVARILAPEAYGTYSVLISLIAIFSTVASLGLRQVVIRTISRQQTNSRPVFALSLALRAGGFILACAVFGIYHLIRPDGLDDFMLLMLLAGVFAQSLWDASENVAFGMQRMQWTSIIKVLASVLILATYLVLPSQYVNVHNVALIYICFFAAQDIAYLAVLARGKFLTSDGTSVSAGPMLKESVPFYILAVFTLFTTQLPVLFLEHNAGDAQVAFFSTSNKLLLPMTLLINTCMSALFPGQAQLFAKDREAFAAQTRKMISFVAAAGVLLAVIVTILSDWLVVFLYGSEYAAAGTVMSLQCWYLVLYGIFCLIGNTFGAADRQNLLATVSIVYAVISLPLLYVGSKYGAEWLSVAFMAAAAINMTYHWHYLRKVLEGRISILYTVLLFGGIALAAALSLGIKFFIA